MNKNILFIIYNIIYKPLFGRAGVLSTNIFVPFIYFLFQEQFCVKISSWFN